MIELLLVAFILSIGLLGLLSLQLVSISSGSQSRMRGTATMLAHNLLDRAVAEGMISSAERYSSGTGTITTTNWVFIDPTGLTANAGTKFYFDIQGNALTSATDPNLVYTVSWQRMAGVLGSNVLAMQPFVVNVQWLEAVKASNGTTALQPHYFSVSRNVSI
jgi:type IV pilus modification protein PilV